MTTHTGLPVAGYKAQSADAVAIVNAFKRDEERLLRKLDGMVRLNDQLFDQGEGAVFDPRWLSIGRTGLEQAFMAINRSVFQPDRVELNEDEPIAKAAHEANRAYCLAIGDDSQPSWEEAPQWQRDSALAGVRFIREHPDASPSASHDSWLAQKKADGWKYGPVKNPLKKEHPCFVPYDELPAEQRAKDHIFTAIVRSLI